MAGDRLLCTEYQLTQRSNDVFTFGSVGDGCHRLCRSTAEDSQVQFAYLFVPSVSRCFFMVQEVCCLSVVISAVSVIIRVIMMFHGAVIVAKPL